MEEGCKQQYDLRSEIESNDSILEANQGEDDLFVNRQLRHLHLQPKFKASQDEK